MKESIQSNDDRWKPVTLEGPIFSSSVEGLIGIEELTNYNLERSSKRGNVTITNVKSVEKKKVRTCLTFDIIHNTSVK